jgi:tetratricopeptide (TPR) repeat protein
MTDLEEAVQYLQQAVEAPPPDSPERARYLNNLGIAFGDRFQRTGQMIDIEEAIRCFQQAVKDTPPGSPERARHLNNLGVGFRDRFRRTSQLADIEETIRCFQQAVEDTSAAHPERARYLDSLGVGSRDRFQRTGQLSDIEEAIRHFQQEVEAASADHPERTSCLSNLGIGFKDRFQSTQFQGTDAAKDLRSASKAFKRALSCSSGVPLTRVTAGRSAASNLVEEGEWNNAADTLQQVLQLLPEVSPLSNSRGDLQYTLQQLSGVKLPRSFSV